MKKIILSLIMGFVLHKVVNEIYDYSWWKNSNECYDRANGVKPYEPNGVAVREACFKEKQGVIWYLQYTLLRPMIGQKKYGIGEKGWNF